MNRRKSFTSPLAGEVGPQGRVGRWESCLGFVEFPKDAFDHVVKALISGRRWKPHDAESL